MRNMAGIRGFIVMEYYALILNRSFVVFTFPQGLYGWKFSGPVTNRDSSFFEPVQSIAADSELNPESKDLQEMIQESGSFVIERSEITSADYDPTPKWGMGGIPHSGKLKVKLRSGKLREFILLGQQDGNAVRAAVLGGTAIMTSLIGEKNSY